MNTQDLIQAESTYVVQTYLRPEIVFSHGKGAFLYDLTGKEYLDFTSGIAVTALGHSDPEWAAAVAAQASKLVHVSNLYHTAPQIELAQKLVDSCFADKLFFCNSGSEANETALKFARKWAKSLTGGGESSPKNKIVAFSGAFHGRTMGALSATYKSKYREPFTPLIPEIAFAEYNNLASAEAAVTADCCAVIVEPVQGEGGVNPATGEFLQGLRALCDANQALLIFDEVQCGLGRTGSLWAHQAYGVTPDIMTIAKPLAGGLPIGAALVTAAVAKVMHPGDHGNTFAGGPLVCTAANVVFDRVNQLPFLNQVAENGAYLRARLAALESDSILAIRGSGLLIGVELNMPVKPIIDASRERGVLLINAGENVLRLAPPLIISRDEIDMAVAVIGTILDLVETAT